MKYRDHRGGLDESMATQIEVNNIDELKDHLNKTWNGLGTTVEEIKFEYYGYDSRINWNTHLVSVRLNVDDFFTVVGMSDGKF